MVEEGMPLGDTLLEHCSHHLIHMVYYLALLHLFRFHPHLPFIIALLLLIGSLGMRRQQVEYCSHYCNQLTSPLFSWFAIHNCSLVCLPSLRVREVSGGEKCPCEPCHLNRFSLDKRWRIWIRDGVEGNGIAHHLPDAC
ncbi:unnamed protein product [Lathyrus sativus]|nr:unnamed protein product [Lathyrus sativus]